MSEANNFFVNNIQFIIPGAVGIITFMQYRLTDRQRKDSLLDKKIICYKSVLEMLNYISSKKVNNYEEEFYYLYRFGLDTQHNTYPNTTLLDLRKDVFFLFDNKELNILLEKIDKHLDKCHSIMEIRWAEYIEEIEEKNKLWWFNDDIFYLENFIQYISKKKEDNSSFRCTMMNKDMLNLSWYINNKKDRINQLFFEELTREKKWEKELAKFITLIPLEIIKFLSLIWLVPKYFYNDLRTFYNLNVRFKIFKLNRLLNDTFLIHYLGKYKPKKKAKRKSRKNNNFISYLAREPEVYTKQQETGTPKLKEWLKNNTIDVENKKES